MRGSGGRRKPSLTWPVRCCHRCVASQDALKDLGVPHCAFNGGNDVWVDVGNKALGIRALQSFMGGSAHQTLHVGDRFTRTGNDTRAREAANSVWVSDPEETNFVMR